MLLCTLPASRVRGDDGLPSRRTAPDALIRPLALVGQSQVGWSGGNIVNGDGSGQSVSLETWAGKPTVFEVLLRKSEASDEVLLKVEEPRDGWKVRAISGRDDITEQVTGAGWLHRFVSTENVKVQVEVFPAANATDEVKQEIVLRATSPVATGLNEDVVKAAITVRGAVSAQQQKPDLLLQLAWEEEFVGGGIWRPDGQRQAKSATIPFGTAQSYVLKVVNRRLETAPVVLHGPRGSGGWSVKYFDSMTGKVEITEAMTGKGWEPAPLESGASLLLRAELTPTLAATKDQEFLVTLASKPTGIEREQIVDGVKVQGVLPQFLQKLQYRTDDMKEGWHEIPESGQVEVIPNQTVTFHAVKGKPDLEWPTGPMKPEWVDSSREGGWNLGENVTFGFPTANTPKTLYRVKAECGKESSVEVRVVNLLKVRLWTLLDVIAVEPEVEPVKVAPKVFDPADPDAVFEPEEPEEPRATNLLVGITDSYRKSVPGLKVRFTRTGGSGEINGPGTADDEGVTDAHGNVTVAFHAGKTVGVARFAVAVTGLNETMRIRKINELDVRLKEPDKKAAVVPELE